MSDQDRAPRIQLDLQNGCLPRATPMVQVDAVEAIIEVLRRTGYPDPRWIPCFAELNPSDCRVLLARIDELEAVAHAMGAELMKGGVTYSEICRMEELQGKVEFLEGENGRLREALGNISRMRTMPDHKTNTFTLVMAHKLAEQALHRDIVDEMEIAKGSVL